MGRNGEDKSSIIEDAPNWFVKLYNWWFHLKIPLVKKGYEVPKNVTVVQGAFNVLFTPGLRKSFYKAYHNFEDYPKIEFEMEKTNEKYHNEVVGLCHEK